MEREEELSAVERLQVTEPQESSEQVEVGNWGVRLLLILDIVNHGVGIHREPGRLGVGEAAEPGAGQSVLPLNQSRMELTVLDFKIKYLEPTCIGVREGSLDCVGYDPSGQDAYGGRA